MKVMQINCVYNKGSTGKITRDIHHGLQQAGIESVVCYGRGAKVDEPNVYKTCSEWYAKLNNLFSRFTGIMYGGCFFSTNRLISIIKKEAPDVVHLQCINGYFVNIYRLIRWLKENHVKTVLTLHAEFMYTANCGYALDCEKWKTGCGHCPRRRKETKSLFLDGTACSWRRMKKAFEGFEELKVVAVSDWIARRAEESSIFSDYDVVRIHNGIALENFCVQREVNEERRLAEAYGIPLDKQIVLHVTPDFQNLIKGGRYFREVAKALPKTHQAVVVGHKGGAVDGFVSVPFVGNQKDLAAMYRAASVLVITSMADNYPTVCIEANCCGTPVVGFDVGGVRETIGNGMGEVVLPFDTAQLISVGLRWAQNKAEIHHEQIEERRAYCDCQRMTRDYISLYNSMVLHI